MFPVWLLLITVRMRCMRPHAPINISVFMICCLSRVCIRGHHKSHVTLSCKPPGRLAFVLLKLIHKVMSYNWEFTWIYPNTIEGFCRSLTLAPKGRCCIWHWRTRKTKKLSRTHDSVKDNSEHGVGVCFMQQRGGMASRSPMSGDGLQVSTT